MGVAEAASVGAAHGGMRHRVRFGMDACSVRHVISTQTSLYQFRWDFVQKAARCFWNLLSKSLSGSVAGVVFPF